MTTQYEIRVKNHLDEAWEDWFDGLTISHEDNGDTLLTGHIADQAALHGVLNRLRDLGIQLISIIPIDTDPRQPREKDA